MHVFPKRTECVLIGVCTLIKTNTTIVHIDRAEFLIVAREIFLHCIYRFFIDSHFFSENT